MFKGLATVLSKAVHVTCLAHGLHQIAETVRLHHARVDQLIASVKKVFMKAPSRRVLFREMHPDLPMPPEPIITRWGTWLQAIIYYANNFDAIRKVFDELKVEDAAAIAQAKELLMDPALKNELVFIKANFEGIVEAIVRLEDSKDRAVDQWTTFCSIVETVSRHDFLEQKVLAVMNRNTGLSLIHPALAVLSPGLPCFAIKKDTSYFDQLPPDAAASLRFAPLTSVDVERSFSRYKSVLRSNRQSFTKDNLRKYIFVHCN